MITDILQLTNYFKSMASPSVTSHKSLLSYFYGLDIAPVTGENASMTYPILWVEPPRVTFKNDKIFFACAINVLKKAAADDFTAQDAVVNECFLIMKDILIKLTNDGMGADKLFVLQENTPTIVPVIGWGSDWSCGVVMELTLESAVDMCHNASHWN